MVTAIFWGLTTGFGIHIAFLLGCKSFKRAKQALASHLIAVLLLSLLGTVLVLLLHRPIFSILKIGTEIYDASLQYFFIYFLGFPIYTFNNIANQFFLATGNSKLPMRISFFTAIGNVVLNFFFIVTLRLGVGGAALATVLVSLLAAIYKLIVLRKELRRLSEDRAALRIDLIEVKQILRLALPCMLQQFAMYFSSVFVQPFINALGPASIAAYSVCLEFYNIVATMFQNSSLGFSTFTAQCVGQKKIGLIPRGLFISARQGILFSLPIIALLLIFPEAIGSIFLKSPNGEAAALIVMYVYTCIPFILFVVFNNLFHNFFRGVQKPQFTLLTTVIYSITRIAATCALIPRLAMTGVFYGFVLAWGVEFIVCMVLYLSKKWKSDEYLDAGREKHAAVSK